MIIKKNQAHKAENASTCTVWEYEYPSDSSSFGTALISGRYPEQGRVLNTECEEIYFVISGSGIVHTSKGDFEVNQGDLFFFEKNQPYWVDGEDLYIALFNTPKWRMDQHRIVD
jgi:mannose-6-phosphate isomerase-like protein (cupin superfamily)